MGKESKTAVEVKAGSAIMPFGGHGQINAKDIILPSVSLRQNSGAVRSQP